MMKSRKLTGTSIGIAPGPRNNLNRQSAPCSASLKLPVSMPGTSATRNLPTGLLTGAQSEHHWLQPGSEVLDSSGKFWVPLITAYSGRRWR